MFYIVSFLLTKSVSICSSSCVCVCVFFKLGELLFASFLLLLPHEDSFVDFQQIEGVGG